jgi:hypothetical protein
MDVKAQRSAALGIASMPKALCILGTAISVLLLVLFGLDLATTFPFGREAAVMDVGFVIASGVLAYVSFTTMREQR